MIKKIIKDLLKIDGESGNAAALVIHDIIKDLMRIDFAIIMKGPQ